MGRLAVEVDEDQEFAESALFSAAAAEEFKEVVATRMRLAPDAMVDAVWATRLLREYDRSYVDIVIVCLRRAEQIRQRIAMHGEEVLRDPGLVIPWVLALEVAAHALAHIEDQLMPWQHHVLMAGRKWLAELPAAELREQFDIPFDCAVCKVLPLPEPHS